jgi:hypothetical protein
LLSKTLYSQYLSKNLATFHLLSMATISYRKWEKMIKLKYYIVVFFLKMLNLGIKEIWLPQEPQQNVPYKRV